MPPFLKKIFNECNNLLMLPVRSVGKQNVPLDENIPNNKSMHKRMECRAWLSLGPSI